jgi:4-amino-4-deoxy-L-arabinose transferase-like glycosyltransferase
MKKILLLIVILILAAGLRLYGLERVPASLDWDEAALGYNAYSILKTGKDEYGTYLPMTFRSFGDYKPPLYVYLTIPSVAVFGLTTAAVRLPSAIAGILAVLGMYLLAGELLGRAQETRNKKRGADVSCFMCGVHKYTPLIAAAIMAISPWHLQFSRVGFESNVALTFVIYGVWAFLYGLRKPVGLLLSVVSFALSMYAYHTPRVFVPMIGATLLVIFWKKLLGIEPYDAAKPMLSIRPWVTAAALLTGLCLVPLVIMTFDSTSLSRFSGTSVFGKQTEVLNRSTSYLKDDSASGNIIGKFVNNRRIIWLEAIGNGYLRHFSPIWLFVTGDYQRHHAPDMGLLYLVELPLLLVGLVVLFTMSGTSKTIIVAWLLMAPIAATMTFETPHAVRAYVMLPMFVMLISLGIAEILTIGSFIPNLAPSDRRAKILLFFVSCFLCIGYIVNISYYLTMYYVATNLEFASYWQYGYKEAIDIAEKRRHEGSTIVMSEKLEQPYIFVLFYTAYDPAKYQKSGGSETKHIDGYTFVSDISGYTGTGPVTYIAKPDELSLPHQTDIQDPGGHTVIAVNEK